MADLIATLKEDHRQILQTLKQVENIGTDFALMRASLNEIREAFLSHLSHEDTEFYLSLRRKVALSADLLRTLDSLIRDLEELKISSLVFFEKYSGKEALAMEKGFAADFHAFKEKLLKRIDIEENQLFPLFARYIRQLP